MYVKLNEHDYGYFKRLSKKSKVKLQGRTHEAFSGREFIVTDRGLFYFSEGKFIFKRHFQANIFLKNMIHSKY